ncbi:MAG: Gfo/Idh/MocA family oxidoreductase [Chloroflexi bacterium]|nr:Gfo/Idh/MocA family oxidoreductase [Chloroflexota bacterium]
MISALEPFRILLVGLGNRGKMWASVINQRPDIALSGVVDIEKLALSTFVSGNPDMPAFRDLSEALRAVTSDAVLLVTPPAGHLQQATLIYDAGLPLLAEKPLTLDLDEAIKIVTLAEKAQLPLAVGLNFRYLPVSRKIRELVTEEVFGAPGFGQFTYQRNRDGLRPGLNKYPLTMKHPMMLEQSIHHLDLIRYCYGREVEQVICRTWNPGWSMYAHDSNVSCLVTLSGGLEVNYLGTWTGGWDELQFLWRTDCSEGVIIQRQLFDDLATATIADPALTAVELPTCRAFYDDSDALLGDFVAHVRQGSPLTCNGVDHLYTLALCFAAIESDERGRVVNMDEFYLRNGVPEPL